MYCPNCGTQTSTEQNFCRSCGLDLEKIAESITEQWADGWRNFISDFTTPIFQPRKKKSNAKGVIALSAFGAGILGLILYGVVYQLILVQGNFFAGFAILGLATLIGTGILSGAYLFAKREVGQKSKTRQISDSQEAMPSAPTPVSLPDGCLEPIPSVTERTTELLAVERNARIKES